MAERYVETLLIRRDSELLPEGSLPTFDDTDVDATFEFEGVIKLTQIMKNVQNVQHNKHDYTFKIISINKLQKE